jgi:hypothetical protein
MYICIDKMHAVDEYYPFGPIYTTRQKARKAKKVNTKYHLKFMPEYSSKICKLTEVR